MSTTVSRKIRWCSALCYWSGLLWFPISLALFTIFPKQLLDYYRFLFSFYLVPSAAVLVAVPFQWLLWKWLGKSHEFVNRCGRAVVNFGLSASLCFIVLALIIFATCGIGSQIGLFLPVVGSFGFIAWCLLLFTHFLLVVVSGFMAIRGKIYTYPWTIQFFR